MDSEVITFSFGQNWRSYVDTVTESSVERSMKAIKEWLSQDLIAGKTVLDIGSGSGIHSLCFHLLGAKQLMSLDVDPASVEATRLMWNRAGQPATWNIIHGSILDKSFINDLGKHDIVYSWGVLHHTGAIWQAIENAASLVENGGKFLIAIYVKGPKYSEHLALKQSYNRASRLGKRLMVWKYIFNLMRERRRAGLNPFAWNEKYDRGMDVYHDIIDWLGGLPYEVASKEEILAFCTDRGFVLEKIHEVAEGANNTYLFSLPK
jgi:SAM-dependent methyltransferase